MTKRPVYYDRDNERARPTTIRALVADPQFRSGYRDRLAGLPPKPLYYDEQVGERRDTWGYERGRLTATWLLANDRRPPRISDIEGLVQAYLAADAAGAVL